jgi:hypothetical protein
VTLECLAEARVIIDQGADSRRSIWSRRRSLRTSKSTPADHLLHVIARAHPDTLQRFDKSARRVVAKNGLELRVTLECYQLAAAGHLVVAGLGVKFGPSICSGK